MLDKLKRLEKTTLDHLNELADAVQQGEAQKAYLPALAAAMPAARSLLTELKAQQMQQLTAQMLVLVEKAHAGRPGEMNGYYGDLFEEGDDDGNAELDFEEFARLMEIIAPSFQGAELRAAFLGAGGSLCPLSAIARHPLLRAAQPPRPSPTPTPHAPLLADLDGDGTVDRREFLVRAPQYAAVEKEFARGGSLKAALAKNMPPPPAAAAAGAAGAAVQKKDAPTAAAAVGSTGAQGDGAKVQKGGGLLKRFMGGGGGGGSQGSDLSQGRVEREKTRVRERNENINTVQRAADAVVVQHGQRWSGLAHRSRGPPASSGWAQSESPRRLEAAAALWRLPKVADLAACDYLGGAREAETHARDGGLVQKRRPARPGRADGCRPAGRGPARIPACTRGGSARRAELAGRAPGAGDGTAQGEGADPQLKIHLRL